MEVKEVEVTKKEKIYELTESEYEDLLVKERALWCVENKRIYNFLL